MQQAHGRALCNIIFRAISCFLMILLWAAVLKKKTVDLIMRFLTYEGGGSMIDFHGSFIKSRHQSLLDVNVVINLCFWKLYDRIFRSWYAEEWNIALISLQENRDIKLYFQRLCSLIFFPSNTLQVIFII